LVSSGGEDYTPAFLAGGGEMGALMRAHDWSRTSLGPPRLWPQPLRITVRIMLNTGHPMYIWWGEDLACLYNDAYRRSIGPERHPGSLGRPAREVWAEIWDIIGPQIEQVMSGGGATWHENQLVPITRHGQREDVYWTYSYGPIDDAAAESGVGGVLVVCTETTAQVSAVRALAAEREQFAQLFEQSPSFMAVLSGPEHRFELANPGYLQLIAHRDVLGKTLREAIPEIEGQGFFELLDTVYASGEAFRGQSVPITLQRTPGAPLEARVLDFVYQPIRDSGGEVTGIFVEGTDVTAEHDSLAALRESEVQFRTLAEAMLNHVWTSTPDGSLDWCNRRAYEFSGAAMGELDGAGWASIVHPDDVGAAQEHWATALATGGPYEAEFRLRRADGVYRWHIARAVAQRGEDGAILRWIGTNTDIEDQKAATEALANLNETLEQQVEERTAELMAAEEALRQSHKMEAVGQLTGGIAHDFNNLLAGVIGSLEVLETRVSQGRLEAVPRYLDAAKGAAQRAAALTQRLLAFSRRQALDPRPVDVDRLIGEMEELIRHTVGPSVAMEVVAAGGMWLTLVDPPQLENALLNLCINARDAMPDGGRLTIATSNAALDVAAARQRDLPPGQYVLIRVTDTGTGMAPEVIARAFDPFFTTKPSGQGTGLGLSMIYGFARQSAGQVRIESAIGRGTSICLYLPRYLGSETDAAVATPSEAASSGGRNETLLVVEDELTIRMFIVDVLEEAGYVVIEARDGPGALEVLRSDADISLLITDLGLSGEMDGSQIADAGRELRPNLKVLYITGYAESGIVDNIHLDRGTQILTKPFAVDVLDAKVRDMLDG
jgi:PAS domain S-box-containing protein